jgi:cytidyltransferase-like protein
MSKNKKEILVATSGYFDPLHRGHLELFERAKKLGTKLVVIVNNDFQARLKKGASFMNEKERIDIVKSLKMVDDAVLSIDKDKAVCKTLASLRPDIFAKGGDSTLLNVPEKEVCDKLGIRLVLGLGDKIQSSSWLLKAAKTRNK